MLVSDVARTREARGTLPLLRAAAFVLPRIGRRLPGLVRWIARRGPLPPQVQLLQRITAYWTGQAISVAADLGVPDRLVDGPRSPAQLAAELQLPIDPLRRLLRALASSGILSEARDGGFSLTELGKLLTRGQPGSLRSLAEISGREWYRAWGELGHSVRSGRSAFEAVYGAKFFDYLEAHPQTFEAFNDGMRGVSSMTDVPIAIAYDFSGFRTITDVGGGSGTQLAALLEIHPRARGILFDRPDVVSHAEASLQTSGEVRRRLSFVGGDFTRSVPAGSDAYLLKSILHDWSDEAALQILTSCRANMPRSARLLVIEHVLWAGPGPQFGKLLDLMMLVALGGRERTRDEYGALLEKAGFTLNREFPTLAEVTVLEAVPT